MTAEIIQSILICRNFTIKIIFKRSRHFLSELMSQRFAPHKNLFRHIPRDLESWSPNVEIIAVLQNNQAYHIWCDFDESSCVASLSISNIGSRWTATAIVLQVVLRSPMMQNLRSGFGICCFREWESTGHAVTNDLYVHLSSVFLYEFHNWEWCTHKYI